MYEHVYLMMIEICGAVVEWHPEKQTICQVYIHIQRV